VTASPLPADWIGRQVVLDVAAPYVYIGTLAGEQAHYLVLDEADAHDLRDSSTTRDQYLIESVRHGIGINRRRVLVHLPQVVGISLFEDIIP
jgi:hypothetical protein